MSLAGGRLPAEHTEQPPVWTEKKQVNKLCDLNFDEKTPKRSWNDPIKESSGSYLYQALIAFFDTSASESMITH